MRTKKHTSKIILAATVAILAMLVSYSAFNNMNKQLDEKQKLIDLIQKTQSSNSNSAETFAYAVAVDNLKAGEIVSDEDVDFKQFASMNTNAFENRSDVVNKVLLQDINSGNAFTTAHIAKISSEDTTLKEGYRALTLPADSFQGRSDKMIVGSNVDIYSANAESSWVLESVKIIGFEGSNASGNNSSIPITSASAITFEVATDDISDFISNISKNKLVLVARNPNDKKVVHKSVKRKNYSMPAKAHYSSFPDLPASLPSSPPISNLSGLPQPIQPSTAPSDAVEVIEANVKSKVTFD